MNDHLPQMQPYPVLIQEDASSTSARLNYAQRQTRAHAIGRHIEADLPELTNDGVSLCEA